MKIDILQWDCSRHLITKANKRSDWLCFFFQAEDGIRDTSVTGVQTCALPISCCSIPCGSGRAGGSGYGASTSRCRRSEERRVGKSVDLGGRRRIKKKNIN